jgi:hypothetical protein
MTVTDGEACDRISATGVMPAAIADVANAIVKHAGSKW